MKEKFYLVLGLLFTLIGLLTIYDPSKYRIIDYALIVVTIFLSGASYEIWMEANQFFEPFFRRLFHRKAKA